MKIIITIFLLSISQISFGIECSEEKALEIGVAAIKRNFYNYKEYEPYQIQNKGKNWLVFGTLPKNRKGGTPKAFIAMSSCKVIKVQHSQ